jgi:hypothetical protein
MGRSATVRKRAITSCCMLRTVRNALIDRSLAADPQA